jgi:uncharacterized OB-fold protein
MTMSADLRPIPDADSAPYWQALREHRLIVQECGACGRDRFPAMPTCPYCASPDAGWHDVDGAATVYSYIEVRRAFDPSFADDVPYVIATVDLAGGARLVARIAGQAAIGDRLAPVFVDHDPWTELRFERSQAP